MPGETKKGVEHDIQEIETAIKLDEKYARFPGSMEKSWKLTTWEGYKMVKISYERIVKRQNSEIARWTQGD